MAADILETFKMSLIMAFRSLPMLLIGFIGFMAIGLGNMGLFVLFIGQTVFLPIFVGLVHIVTGGMEIVHVPTTDVSQLVPSAPHAAAQINVGPSFWLAQFLFFMGYLMANAVALYTVVPDPNLDDIQVGNQKSKAATAITTTVILILGMTYLRYLTHTETVVGVALAFLIGIGGGYGWYQLAAACGARAADVFGISQQIVPNSAKDTKPMTCVYSPKP